jgi:hypothetical protein
MQSAKATLERSGGKLTLFAEQRIELALFDNRDLTRGYAKTDGEYSDVYCTKTRRGLSSARRNAFFAMPPAYPVSDPSFPTTR